MASSENEPPRLGLLPDAERAPRCKPSPLRIVKSRGVGAQRQASGSSGERADSAAELPGRDGRLTVMKRRGGREGQEGLRGDDSGDGDDLFTGWSPFPSCAQSAVPRFEGKGWEQILLKSQGVSVSPTLSVRKRRQRRPPIENCMPRVAGRHRDASSCAVPLERGDCLTNKDPFLQLSTDASKAGQEILPGVAGLPSPEHLLFDPTEPTTSIENRSQKALSYVLSPHVSVTPEVAGIYDGDGGCSVWAAVEVSAKLCKASTTQASGENSHLSRFTSGSFIDHHTGMYGALWLTILTVSVDRFFEFGCLFDLTVEVLPTDGTSITQVLREQPFPT